MTEEDLQFQVSITDNDKRRIISLEPMTTTNQPLCSPKKLRFSSTSGTTTDSTKYEMEINLALAIMPFATTGTFLDRYVPKITSYFIEKVLQFGDDVGFLMKAAIKIDYYPDDYVPDAWTIEEGMDDDDDDGSVIDMDNHTSLWPDDQTNIPRYYCDDGDDEDCDSEMYLDDDDRVVSMDYVAGMNDDYNVDDSVFSMDNVSRTNGVPTTVIESLRKDGKIEGENVEGEKCIVCFEEYQCLSTDVLKTACSHLFHDSCISEWLQTNNSCPVCRKMIQ